MKIVAPPVTIDSNFDTWIRQLMSMLRHVPSMYLHTFIWDPPSIASGSYTTTTQTVNGVSLGDWCLVSANLDISNLIATAYVSASDTVMIELYNPTGSAIDLASTTWNVLVLKKD